METTNFVLSLDSSLLLAISKCQKVLFSALYIKTSCASKLRLVKSCNFIASIVRCCGRGITDSSAFIYSQIHYVNYVYKIIYVFNIDLTMLSWQSSCLYVCFTILVFNYFY